MEFYDGLIAKTQNGWPSMRLICARELFVLADFRGRLLLQDVHVAGVLLGEALRADDPARGGSRPGAGVPDPDHYENGYAFCDLLVIGSGPSGLSAALVAAARGGARAACEEDFCLRRPAARDPHEVNGPPGVFGRRAVAELAGFQDVRLMSRTTVFGCYDHGVFGALERVKDHLPIPAPDQPRQRLWRIVAERACSPPVRSSARSCSATTIARSVMLAGAARLTRTGSRLAVATRGSCLTNNNDGWPTAADLRPTGIPSRRWSIAQVGCSRRNCADLAGACRLVNAHRARAGGVSCGASRLRRVDGPLPAMQLRRSRGVGMPTLDLPASGRAAALGGRIAAFVPVLPPEWDGSRRRS